MRRCPSCGITTESRLCLGCWGATVLLPDPPRGHQHGLRYTRSHEGCLRAPGWTSGTITTPTPPGRTTPR